MTEVGSDTRRAQKRRLLAIVVVAAVAFILVLAVAMRGAWSAGGGTAGANAYATEVAAVLDGADADVGAQLMQTYDCAACHLEGDGRNSPLFAGIADLAANRRPPLSAEQYLYEAILFPGLHLVDGYTNAMPNDYDDRLPPAEVGHMIAYLLTLSQATADS